MAFRREAQVRWLPTRTSSLAVALYRDPVLENQEPGHSSVAESFPRHVCKALVQSALQEEEGERGWKEGGREEGRKGEGGGEEAEEGKEEGERGGGGTLQLPRPSRTWRGLLVPAGQSVEP